MVNDTHPDAEKVLYALAREMPIPRKLEILFQLNDAMRTLVLMDLRRQHPHASEAELRRRLAGRLYGEELAEKAYGPLPPADGSGT